MLGRWQHEQGDHFNQRFTYDESTKQIIVQYSQPVDRIIRNNQRRRREEDNSERRRRGELYQIADIPVGIVMEWRAKYGVDINIADHWPAVMELIASRDYNKAVAVVDGKFLHNPVRTHFVGARDRASHPLGSNYAANRVKAGGLVKTGVF